MGDIKRSKTQMLLYIGARLALSLFATGVGQADMVSISDNGFEIPGVRTHTLSTLDSLSDSHADPGVNASGVGCTSQLWASRSDSPQALAEPYSYLRRPSGAAFASALWKIACEGLPGLPVDWDIAAVGGVGFDTNAAAGSVTEKKTNNLTGGLPLGQRRL